jgi:hypothetical protein
MKDEEIVLDGLIEFDIAGPAIIENQPVIKEETEEEPATDTNIPDNDQDDEPEIEEGTQDDQAVAAFSLFKEFGVIDEIPEKPTIEAFKELGEKLPEMFLEQAIESSPQLFKDVLLFAHSKPNLTKQDLIAFIQLDNNVEELPKIESTEDADLFLQKELTNDKKFKSATALKLFLDAMDDDDKLELAKDLLKEKEDTVTSQKKAAIEAAKAEKIAKEAQQKEYVDSLYSAIESFGWDKKKIESVKSTLTELPAINKIILDNPETYAEYLNFLSTLDKKTGKFDTTKFELRKATATAKSTKDNIINDKVSSVLANLTVTKNNHGSGKKDGLRPV